MPEKNQYTPNVSSRNLWRRFLELQDAACDVAPAKLPRLVSDIRALIRDYHEAARRPKTDVAPENRVEPTWEAAFRRLHGYALRLSGNKEGALSELRFAWENDRSNLHHLEEFVAACLHFGAHEEAAQAVSALRVGELELEHDSTAAKLLQWAMNDIDFARLLDGRIVKVCLELVAKYSDRNGSVTLARTARQTTSNG